MAITFVGKSTGSGLGRTSLTVSRPAGAANGDVLVAFFVTSGLGSNVGSSNSLPSGWTPINSTNQFIVTSYASDLSVATKIASSEPTTWTFNCDDGSGGAVDIAATVLAYRGAVGVAGQVGSAAYAGASAPTEDVVIVNNGDVALCVIGSDAGAGNTASGWTPPTGFTNRASINNNSVSIEVSDKTFSSPGVLGAQTATVTPDSEGVAAMFTVLIQPAFFVSNLNGVNVGGCMAGHVGTAAVPDISFTPSGVHATGHVGNVAFDITSAALPAFQFNAFQDTAFQTETHAHVSGVQGVGNIGDVDYAVGYAAPAVFATGSVGAVGYRAKYDVTGVEGTGEVGTPDFTFDMNFGVFGVTATGYVGTADTNVPAFQSSAFQLNAFQTAPATNQTFGAPAVFATGHVGSVVYKAGYDVTGVSATGALGTITFLTGQTVNVTGVVGTGHVGTPTVNWDFSFALPRGLYELRAMRGLLGTISTARDSSPAADSVIATGYVGSVVYESSVSPDGLEASGVLGDISFITDSSPAPAGVFAFGGLGTVRFKVEYTIAGVQGAGAVGTPVVKVTPELVTTGLSVSGGGHVGTVGFIIDCNVYPTGLQSSALLHGFALRVDSDAAVTGVEASGAVGDTVEENLYAVAGVHGTGHVGTTSPTHAIAVRGVTALGEVGEVVIHHDMTVFPTGVTGTGLIGSPEFPHLVVVDRDKMIYTRAPQPGH